MFQQSIVNKTQRELRKLTVQEYHHLYPTGSNPDRFYGTAKLNKPPPNDTMEEDSLLILSKALSILWKK